MLAGCAARLPPPPAPRPPQPVRFTAVLQPGCLLPHPTLLRKSPASHATLALHVDATGQVESATVRDSAGNHELDAALQAAAMRCKFTPAYVVEGSARTEVPDDHVLNLRWPAEGALVGSARCITPEYPHAARRAEEMGRIVVQFRKSPSTGQPEVQLRPTTTPVARRILQPLSLRAVSECLAHDEVAAELPPDKWYAAEYNWILD